MFWFSRKKADVLNHWIAFVDGFNMPSLDAFFRARNQHDYKLAGQIYRDSKIHYAKKQALFTELLIQGKRPSDLHIDLIRIGFNGFLTTNYDHLIEDAFAFLHGSSLLPYLPADLGDPNFEFGDRFFVAKVHGDAGRWNSIVIGEKDYEKANWAIRAARLVADKTLIVLGISGRDYLINQFLLNIDPKTRVLVFMSEDTRDSYEASIRSINPNLPTHIITYEIPHADLGSLIHELANSRATPCLKDCSWGEMPPQQPGRLLFGETSNELRRFLSSDLRTCCVHANPGFGLSSFLVGVPKADSALVDGKTTAVRREIKVDFPTRSGPLKTYNLAFIGS